MIFLLILLFWIAPVVLGAMLGNSRNKLAAGILLPLFFGWLGVIIVACLSDRSQHVTVNVSQHGPGYVEGLKDGE
jgi:hypothetical protein